VCAFRSLLSGSYAMICQKTSMIGRAANEKKSTNRVGLSKNCGQKRKSANRSILLKNRQIQNEFTALIQCHIVFINIALINTFQFVITIRLSQPPNGFSRFGKAHKCDQQTDRQSDVTPSATIGRYR